MLLVKVSHVTLPSVIETFWLATAVLAPAQSNDSVPVIVLNVPPGVKLQYGVTNTACPLRLAMTLFNSPSSAQMWVSIGVPPKYNDGIGNGQSMFCGEITPFFINTSVRFGLFWQSIYDAVV